MTKKEFKKWLSESPAICVWGYDKLAKISGLKKKEIELIVKPFRAIYRASIESKEEISQEIYRGIPSEVIQAVAERVSPTSNVRYTNEFQAVNSKIGEYNIAGIHIAFPCVHVPHENTDLMCSASKLIQDLGHKVKGFHILGDFLDMSALSSHDKGNISSDTLSEEYEAGNAALDFIEDSLPDNILKTYIWGNHEDRYFRYMRNVDNAKLGTALQSPTVALKLHERGYKVFEDWKNSYVTIGKHLTLSHGEFCNVHTAKKHLDTYRKSILYAHTHRKQVYVEGNMGAYNVGSMADFTSHAFGYATRAMKESWVNSFAVITIDIEGYYNVEIPTWYKGKLVFGGKTY